MLPTMKKILVAVGAVATAVGVAWLNRDRLLPLPEQSTTPAPRVRPAPEPATAQPGATEAADDLTRIAGIGPVYSGRLAAHGITSFAGLAEADIATLAGAIEVPESQVADWADQARSLSP